MKHLNFHNEFSLNGKKFNSVQELISYSKTISSSVFSFLVTWFDNHDYVVVQTSGSTGIPKQIRLKKIYMCNSATATGSYFELAEGTNALLCLSTDYIAGKMMLVRALVLGWHVDIVEASSNPLEHIEKVYDFSAMIPLQVYNSYDKLRKVKKLIVGGGTISNDLQQKISGSTTLIFATYGMTETSTHIAIKKLNNYEDVTLSGFERSLYTILPKIQISTDKRGCLVIDAPTRADALVLTNDLVEVVSGSTFKWLGRYDTIINSGGVKLIPEQIEEKLASVIDERFFVGSLPDELLGEKLILVVESKKGNNTMLNSIKNIKTLSKFETPKEIYFIEKFVETETKKINRNMTIVRNIV